jgi:RimJ/RimL family protein N-acetyltransferase
MCADPVVIRLLTPENAQAFRALRARSMDENPAWFSSDAQTVREQHLDVVIQQLSPGPEKPNDFVLGAFQEDELVGIIGLIGRYRVKERHNATVVGLYVMPGHTGHGLGSTLIKALLARARRLPGLTQLDLSVTQANERAQALYARFGFIVFGVQPNALRIGSQFYSDVLMSLSLCGTARNGGNPP